MTIRLRTNVMIQICSVAAVFLINMLGNPTKPLVKTVLVTVAIIQAAAAYLAHHSTLTGTRLVDRNLKKMT